MNDSQVVDSKVVELSFENRNFESNAKASLDTLQKLKRELDMSDALKGIDESKTNLNTLKTGINSLGESFETAGNMAKLGIGQIARIKIVSDVIGAATSGVANLAQKFTDLNTATAVTKQIFGAAGAIIDLGNVTTQMSAGFEKYAQKTTAVQTIMAATAKNFTEEQRKSGEQMEYVNSQLKRLNWFTDETSYNFTDMVNNIGKFTSNNVALDDSVTAMQGISTWAAKSGANVGEASRAMYNLSQAMAVGQVKLIDWKSIENANMATAEFKQTAIETAEAMGTLTKVSEDTWKTVNGGKEVSVKNFNENLSQGWFTSEVLMKSLDKYGAFSVKLSEVMNDTLGGSDIDTTSELLKLVNDYIDAGFDASKMEGFDEAVKKSKLSAKEFEALLKDLGSEENKFGREAFQAAQEAKTWEEAIDSVKDATSTAWMNTFELLFGNYEQAKKLYTDVANSLWDVFAGPINDFNERLEEAFASTGGAISKSEWAELEESGIANPAYIKAVKAAAKAHGIAGADIVDDERFINFVLEKGLLTIDELQEAYDGLYGGTADAEMTGKLVDLISDADEETQKYLDTIKAADKEDFSKVIFGNGQYEEGYEELEGALDGLMKKLGFSQEQGEAFVEALKATGSIDGTIAALSAYSDEQLKSMGLTDEQIEKTRALAEENKSFADALGEESDILSNHKSGQELWLESLSNGLEILTSVLGVARVAFGNIMPPASADAIYSFAKGLAEVTGKIKNFVTNSETFSDIISGVAAFFNIIATIIEHGVVFAFTKLWDILGPLVKWLGSIFGLLGKGLVSLNKWITSGKALKDLAVIFGPAIDSFKNKIQGLFNAFTKLPVVSLAINKFSKAFKEFSPEKLSKYFGKLGDRFGKFRDKVKALGGIKLSNLKEAFGALKENVLDYIANFPGFKKLQNAFTVLGKSVKTQLSNLGVPMDLIQEKLGGFFGTVKETVVKAPETIQKGIGKVKEWFGAFQAMPMVQNNLSRFKTAFGNAFKQVGPYLSGLGGRFKTFFSSVKEMSGSKFSKATKVLASFKDNILDYFANFPGFDGIKSAFSGLWTDISNGLKSYGIDVNGIIANIKSAFTGIWTGIKTWLGEYGIDVDGIIETVTGVFGVIRDAVVKAFTDLFAPPEEDENGETLKFTDRLLSVFKTLGSDIKKGLKTYGIDIDGIKDTVTGVFGTVKNAFATAFDTIFNPSDKNTSIFERVKTAFTNLWTDITDGLKNYDIDLGSIGEALKEKVSALWNKVTSFLSDHGIDIEGIKEKITSFFEPIVSIFEALFGTSDTKTVTSNKTQMGPAVQMLETVTVTLAEVTGMTEDASAEGGDAEDASDTATSVWDTIYKGLVKFFKITGKVFGIIAEHAKPMLKAAIGIIAIKKIFDLVGGLSTYFKGKGKDYASGGFLKRMTGIALVIAAIAGAALVFAQIGKLDTGTLAKGGLALVAVAGVFTAFFWLLSLIKSEKLEAIGNLSGVIFSLAAVIAAIGAALLVVSIIPEKRLKNAATAIGAIIGCIALLAGVMGLTKPALKSALSIILVLGAVGGAIFLLQKFTDPEKALTIAESLSKVFIALGAMFLMLGIGGILGGVSLSIITPLLAIVGIITVIALVLAGIQALGDFLGLGDFSAFLTKAMDLLYILAEGVGKAIGALFGNMAGEAISSAMSYLPEIANYVVDFVTNLQPLNELGPIRWDALIGALAFVAGGAFVGWIGSLLTTDEQAKQGKTAAEQFASDLVAIADAIAHWQEAMADIDKIKIDGGGIVKLGLTVAGLSFAGWLSAMLSKETEAQDGTTAAERFAGDLTALGDAIANWQEKMDSIGEITVDGKGISDLAKAVVGINFIGLISALETKAAQLIAGTKGKSAMDLFTEDLGKLANAVTGWQDAMSKYGEDYEFNTEGITNLGDAVTAISFDALQQALLEKVNSKLGLTDESGNSLVEQFGQNLTDLGDAMTGWADSMPSKEELEAIPTDINSVITGLGDAISAVSFDTLVSQLEEKVDDKLFDDGGEEGGKTLIQKFGDNLTQLGEAIDSYNTALQGKRILVRGTEVTKLSDAIGAIETSGLTTKIKKIFEGETNFEAFQSDLVSLGTALSAYNDALGTDIDLDKFDIAVKALEALTLLGKEDKQGATAMLKEMGSELPMFGQKLKELVDTEGLDYEKLDAMATAAEKLGTAESAIANLELESGDVFDDEIVTVWVSNLNAVADTLSALTDMDFSGVDTLSTAASTASSIKLSDNAGEDTGKDMANNAAKGVKDNESMVSGALTSVTTDAASSVDTSAFASTGTRLIAAMADAIWTFTGVSAAVRSVVSSAVSVAGSYTSSISETGKYFAIGYANGITENTFFVRAAAIAMVSKAKRAVEEAQKSGSPSKVTKLLGGYFGEGFALGIDATNDIVTKSAGNLGSAAIDNLNSTIKAVSDVLGSEIDGDPVIRPVLDLSEIQNGAGYIGDLLNANGPVGINTNFGAISSNLSRSRGATTDDVVSALSSLKDTLGARSDGNTYNINGITYDDGSNITDAVDTLVRAVIVGGRA